MLTSRLAAGAAPVKIRHSAKAKRLRLAVKPGLIELVVPHGATESLALAFLEKHRSWAEGKLLEMNGRVARLPPAFNFADSPSVPWQGRELPLLVQSAAGRRVRVSVDDAVRIVLPEGLGLNRDELALRAFYQWVRPWLGQRVVELAKRHAPLYGLQPRDIRIKRMQTRWGSCGPRNDLNINWLLALTPEPVLEYVVVHELCHIRERNHAPRFWTLVAKHLPDYAKQRQWLKDHGGALMRRFKL
jgi:predicted metal-dependent hydrolase